MEEVLWELVEEVGGRLRQEEFFARCLTVKIRYSNFQTITRSRTLASPTCFDKEIFQAVSDLLRQNIAQGRAVRLLGVSASALQTSGWQEPLLNREQRESFGSSIKASTNCAASTARTPSAPRRRANALVDFAAKLHTVFHLDQHHGNHEPSFSRRLPARTDFVHAGLADAPGRPLHGRVSQAARPIWLSRAVQEAGSRHRDHRHAGGEAATSTRRYCSPISC